MQSIRILVVEDSLTVRKHIVEILNAEEGFEVIGEAENGQVGIEKCRQMRPDVMTLDMMLPVMSGVSVTEYIMAYCPTPILIVSASTNRGELFKTYEALAAGAVDVLEKPVGDDCDQDWGQRLIEAVRVVSRIKVITHIRARLETQGHALAAHDLEAKDPFTPRNVVAIGGSTGGPGAINQILRQLPVGFPLPILLVIHISEPFGTAFADWLNGQSTLTVRYAEDGEPVPRFGQAGIFMAPPGRHLIVERGHLRLNTSAERHSCRPSVDILFESLAKEMGPETVACLLTGMGKDGASGLLDLKRAGALTLAQDEASSVVFGMPREAIQIGAVDRILDLEQIASTLTAVAKGDGHGRKK
ncbi:chemotaxis-specific protein-glutamate methyltransferase CheB [Oligoflexus tunisiensis]|uniref:chemotaxis-specific protein-glutamate methyltransferase CheB n=1 Tax=Oligoflexus tunisiensis TaxID=708132 RepID=UPI000AC6C664|nr:chemotaxis-specific protein-glutamate methyltransferase CheB [Oligoflexus tunisiensis]